MKKKKKKIDQKIDPPHGEMDLRDEPDFYSIDVNRLDEEWLRQPKLYHTYADKLANAREDLEQAKSKLDLVSADLDSDIRESPEEYGLGEKLTEGAIKATIVKQEAYQKANLVLSDLRRRVGVLGAAVATLDHRKRALQHLAELWMADYFSTPRAKTEGTREKFEQHEKDEVRGKRRIKQREGDDDDA